MRILAVIVARQAWNEASTAVGEQGRAGPGEQQTVVLTNIEMRPDGRLMNEYLINHRCVRLRCASTSGSARRRPVLDVVVVGGGVAYTPMSASRPCRPRAVLESRSLNPSWRRCV